MAWGGGWGGGRPGRGGGTERSCRPAALGSYQQVIPGSVRASFYSSIPCNEALESKARVWSMKMLHAAAVMNGSYNNEMTSVLGF